MRTEENRFMGSVKVGPKGQIVIPKEVRGMFEISPGDTLVILADAKKGIAIEKYSTFNEIADAIFAGKAREVYPQTSQEEAVAFAKHIKELKEDEERG